MVIYDIEKRISICEEMARKGTTLSERVFYLDSADILKIREREKRELETFIEELKIKESCPLRYS